MFNPDLIVGIGGGSVLDYAKIVSILKTEDRIENLIKNAKLMAIVGRVGSGKSKNKLEF